MARQNAPDISASHFKFSINDIVSRRNQQGSGMMYPGSIRLVDAAPTLEEAHRPVRTPGIDRAAAEVDETVMRLEATRLEVTYDHRTLVREVDPSSADQTTGRRVPVVGCPHLSAGKVKVSSV
jgi:hypothetical protein